MLSTSPYAHNRKELNGVVWTQSSHVRNWFPCAVIRSNLEDKTVSPVICHRFITISPIYFKTIYKKKKKYTLTLCDSPDSSVYTAALYSVSPPSLSASSRIFVVCLSLTVSLSHSLLLVRLCPRRRRSAIVAAPPPPSTTAAPPTSSTAELYPRRRDLPSSQLHRHHRPPQLRRGHQSLRIEEVLFR